MDFTLGWNNYKQGFHIQGDRAGHFQALQVFCFSYPYHYDCITVVVAVIIIAVVCSFGETQHPL